MKKLSFLLITLMAMVNFAIAQVPQGINYQTVVRNTNGNPVTNQAVAFRISVLEDNALGNAVYTEEHRFATNALGLVNFVIGKGNPVAGDFETINWGSTTFFIKVETDITGGSNYVETGTQQLMSVPYSLYSKSSSFADSVDIDAQLQNSSTLNTTILSVVASNPTITDNQTLTLTNDTLFIERGNYVLLPNIVATVIQNLDSILLQSNNLDSIIVAQTILNIDSILSQSSSLDSIIISNTIQNIDSILSFSNTLDSIIINTVSSSTYSIDTAYVQNDSLFIVNGNGNIINAGNVRGPQGATGTQGQQGVQGVQGPAGATGATGATGAQGATGATGAQGPQGAQGVAGTNGTNGVDGKTILNGTSNPSPALGTTGDFYINTSSNTLFGPKTVSGWGSGTSLVGPQGPTGATGATGPQGATGATGAQGSQGVAGTNGTNGADGKTILNGTSNPSTSLGTIGDFYINTSSNTLFGPKTVSGWGSGTSLVGPQGSTGAQGLIGATGPQGSTGPQGATGATGATGHQGPQGVAGTNGTNGADGKNTLAKTTTEVAGANCTTGGVKIEYGLDANSNGNLDAGEINATLTKYVCNGAVGAIGATGATGATGPQGPAGATGAQGFTNPIAANIIALDTARWNAAGNDWKVNGNAGTNPITNFIGTSDNQDLVIRTNNTEKVRIKSSGNVGIGTNNPSPTAITEMQSTTQGFLPPRMTSTQRDAILNPGNGLMIFNLTTGCPNYYFNGFWYDWCGTIILPIGTITALSCGLATNNGTLTSGIAASGVSSSVPYTGGNGGTHNGQTVTSIGVTGLTATLTAGTFANGAGSLTYTITGTPSGSGTASFGLNIGGQTCLLTRTVALPIGTITALNCGTATNTGLLTSGIAASGVSSSVPYTGGNGGTHNGQTVTSTGVTGLTATLVGGTFASGGDSLTYIITGTPNSEGTASFLLDVGGQTCILSVIVFPAPLTLGQNYQGGIIAYLDGTGQHGLIVSNVEYSGLWGDYGNFAWSESDGYSNTNTAANFNNSPNLAVAISWNLSLNGYSDWYLPAKNQLAIVYQNILSQGILPMSGSYWSSTSVSTNWAWWIQTNGVGSIGNKLGGYLYFRPVRSF
jgi:hypothetical protein